MHTEHFNTSPTAMDSHQLHSYFMFFFCHSLSLFQVDVRVAHTVYNASNNRQKERKKIYTFNGKVCISTLSSISKWIFFYLF